LILVDLFELQKNKTSRSGGFISQCGVVLRHPAFGGRWSV